MEGEIHEAHLAKALYIITISDKRYVILVSYLKRTLHLLKTFFPVYVVMIFNLILVS